MEANNFPDALPNAVGGEALRGQREQVLDLLRQQRQRLQSLGTELATRRKRNRQQLDEAQHERGQEQQWLDQTRQQLDEREQALERERVETIERWHKLKVIRQRLAVGRQRLKQRHQQCRERRQTTERQRRRLARLVAAQRTRLRRRLQMQDSEVRALNEQLDSLQRHSTAAAAMSDQLQSLKRQLAVALDQITLLEKRNVELEDALQEARDDTQRQEVGEREAEQRQAMAAELEQLRTEHAALAGQYQAERATLIEQLGDAKAQLAAAASQESPDAKLQQELEDATRRCELAVEDVKELKAQNKKLSEKLVVAEAAPSSAPVVGGQALDWEAQKRLLLETLGRDPDPDDPQVAQERMTIEGTIQITDEIVARKDTEIEELKQRVAERDVQAAQAVQQAAQEEMLDQDEMIRQQRRKLTALEAQWEGKLRQAEVDISVERAKIARQRVAVEEQSRELEAKLKELENDPRAAIPGEPAKPRYRWLRRLGLKDKDEA